MNYYNAIVLTSTGESIKLHKVTQPANLIKYYKNLYREIKVFFYLLESKKDKKGSYCGYYNELKGLQLNS